MIIIRKLFFILIIFVFSCSKNDKTIVDIKSFLKEGKEVSLINYKNQLNIDKSIIKNLKIVKRDTFLNWPQENYNVQNLIGPSNVNILKKKKIISGNFKKIVSYQDKIITISNNSEISIFDKNLKKILSKKIYKRKIYKNYDIQYSIAVQKKEIFISNSLGEIFCFSIDDLKIKWKKNLSVPFQSDIKIHNNLIYLINSNSKIYSIDTKNGNIIWSFETTSKNIKNKLSYQIAFFENNLYFTNDNAEIFCINLIEKKIKWSLIFEIQSFKQTPLVFKSNPITIDDNGNLFISTNYGFTYSIDARQGNVNWSKEFYSLNNFIFTEKYLMFSNLNRFIMLDKKNGKIIYNKPFFNKSKKELFLKDLIIGKDNIYLFDIEGYLFTIKLNNFDTYYTSKFSHNYKDYLILKNNLFILSDNSITQY